MTNFTSSVQWVYLVTPSTTHVASQPWVMPYQWPIDIHCSPAALPRSLFADYAKINLALYVSPRLILPVRSFSYYLDSGANKSLYINEIAREVSWVHLNNNTVRRCSANYRLGVLLVWKICPAGLAKLITLNRWEKTSTMPNVAWICSSFAWMRNNSLRISRFRVRTGAVGLGARPGTVCQALSGGWTGESISVHARVDDGVREHGAIHTQNAPISRGPWVPTLNSYWMRENRISSLPTQTHVQGYLICNVWNYIEFDIIRLMIMKPQCVSYNV